MILETLIIQYVGAKSTLDDALSLAGDGRGIRLLRMEDFDDKPLNPLTPDPEPEEERATEGGSKLMVVAMLLALGGLAVGVVGIVMANQASRQISELKQQLADVKGPGQELALRLDDHDARLVALDSEIVKLGRTDRMHEGAIQENRQALVAMNGNLERLTSGVAEVRQAAPTRPTSTATTSTPSTSGGSDGSATPTTASGRTYTIKAGDTFSKIAREYGTTIAAIEAANPGVQSSRLKIGQEINLP